MNQFLNIRKIYTVNNNTLYALDLTYEFEKVRINAATKEEYDYLVKLAKKEQEKEGTKQCYIWRMPA